MRDEVLALLKQYTGKRFPANEIAKQVTGKDKADRHLYNALDLLEKSGKIVKEPQDPSKDIGNRNPFVYWHDRTAAAAAEAVSHL